MTTRKAVQGALLLISILLTAAAKPASAAVEQNQAAYTLNLFSDVDGVNVYTGDSNNNGKIDLGDAITILSYQFSGGATPACFKAADANDDDKVNIADAITILGYQFQSGSMKAPDHTSAAPSLITSANVGCHTFDPADVSVAGCDAPCTDPTPLK